MQTDEPKHGLTYRVTAAILASKITWFVWFIGYICILFRSTLGNSNLTPILFSMLGAMMGMTVLLALLLNKRTRTFIKENDDKLKPSSISYGVFYLSFLTLIMLPGFVGMFVTFGQPGYLQTVKSSESVKVVSAGDTYWFLPTADIEIRDWKMTSAVENEVVFQSSDFETIRATLIYTFTLNESDVINLASQFDSYGDYQKYVEEELHEEIAPMIFYYSADNMVTEIFIAAPRPEEFEFANFKGSVHVTDIHWANP